jgi:hypothetical protein
MKASISAREKGGVGHTASILDLLIFRKQLLSDPSAFRPPQSKPALLPEARVVLAVAMSSRQTCVGCSKGHFASAAA